MSSIKQVVPISTPVNNDASSYYNPLAIGYHEEAIISVAFASFLDASS